MAKRALVQAQIDNLKLGDGFSSSEKARKAAYKSHESRARNKSAKQVFNMLLASIPTLDDKTKDTLIKLGVKQTDDTDIMTLIGAAMAQKAMRGDNKAAQFVFKMAGQDGESEIMKERNEIEKAKLQLEREKLEALKANQSVTVGDNSLIRALSEAAAAGVAAVVDEPENADAGEEQ